MKIRKSVKKVLVALALVTAILMQGTVFPVNVCAANKSAVVTTAGGGLNVRSGPGKEYSIIASVSNGSSVTTYETTNGWTRIAYSTGKYGYVRSDYLKTVSAASVSSASLSGSVSSGSSTSGYPKSGYVATLAGNLNLRESASITAGTVASIPKGAQVTITGKYNSNWYSATYCGKKGYVNAAFISFKGSSYKYPAVALSGVVKYRQGDSRWANITLGKTWYTIHAKGCLACAMASLETYTYGKTVTPADIVANRTFDSTAGMYWPSTYATCSDSNYMAEIYELLQEGKPVAISAKTSTGRQHWVTITGCTSTNTLTPSCFTILDGAFGYTTLQEFYDHYPYFYKYAYLK